MRPVTAAMRQLSSALNGSTITTTPGLTRSRPGPGRDRRAEPVPGPVATSASEHRSDSHVAVIGGGIAGTAAAVALSERGVRVTMLEKEPTIGGRVRSWPVVLPDGEPVAMSRGFHAFFRQYYNLRSLLRRIDPTLERLQPIGDYPLLHRDGSRDSFTSIPRTPPLNMAAFVAASPSFGLRDLPRVHLEQAIGLLDVDFPRTFSDYDGISADEVLQRLNFPAGMRDLALEVFSRSFFCDPHHFSGGELIGMFHTYFLGSAEGLLFDVCSDDFDSALWGPLTGYLRGHGADVRCSTRVEAMDRDADGFLITTSEQTQLRADAVVLATDRKGLQNLIRRSPWMGDERWRESITNADMAPRFIVHRIWFDTPSRPDTAPFVGTAGFGPLDNVSAVHLFERGAADWARGSGGSVMELHAYAVPDERSDAETVAELRHWLFELHPELAEAGVIHEEVLVNRDCPLIGTDAWASRPGVVTADPDIVLAGDGIRCDLPVALMERAATTGFQAANHLLEQRGLSGEPLWTVPTSTRFPRSVSMARQLVSLTQKPALQRIRS